MASKNIKGITIEIGGESTELQKALRKPESDAKNLQKELREVNNSLKFSPDSLVLLAQKSEVLGNEIAVVSEKLRILRDSQAQIQEQAERGDIGIEQYRAFQRELEGTSEKLDYLKSTLKENGESISEVGQRTGETAQKTDAYRQAVVSQQSAVKKAKTSTDEHGKSVRNLKDDYGEAERGALSFGDVVKASAIGNLIASGLKRAASALWDFAMQGAEAAKEFETNQQKLTHIMKNTIEASDDEIESIKQLIATQEQLGVVTQNAQTAAAQELATYTSKTKALETLIPVMNDMIAQQYGVNATQEQAVTVATAVGKTLDGQVGSLSRWGYTFSEAEKSVLGSNAEMSKTITIARVVSGSVGGLSESLRKGTTQGDLFGQSLRIGQVQEEFGRNAEKIKSSILITLLPSLTEGLEVINEYIIENGDLLTNLGSIVATIINGLTMLLRIVSAIPAPVLMLIGVFAMAIKTFTSVDKGLSALSNATKAFGFAMDPTTIKILALIAAVSVLLFLILSLKEGTDRAADSMKSMSNAADSMSKTNVNTAKRGYATGTSNARRGLAWVGEEGPELVNFRGGERVFTARQSAQVAQGASAGTTIGSQTAVYQITVSGLAELQEFLDFQDNMRRRGRALNGGT